MVSKANLRGFNFSPYGVFSPIAVGCFHLLGYYLNKGPHLLVDIFLLLYLTHKQQLKQ